MLHKHTSINGSAVARRTGIAGLGLPSTFQNIRLFSQLTVRENVEATSAPGTHRSSVDEVLAWFGLGAVEREKAEPRVRHAAPAGDRAGRRSPSVADPARRAGGRHERVRVRRAAREHPQDPVELACSVVVVDHDLRLIMKLCDRIQVLDQGRTIALGLPGELAEDPVVIEAYLGEPLAQIGIVTWRWRIRMT